MKILSTNITPDQAIEIFYNALCNGLTLLPGYGLALDYDEDEYETAQKQLTAPCFEDVLIQLLKDGNSLTIQDVEGDGQYTRSITIDNVYHRVPMVPMHHLIDIEREEDDAITADAVIQTVFFQEIIFG